MSRAPFERRNLPAALHVATVAVGPNAQATVAVGPNAQYGTSFSKWLKPKSGCAIMWLKPKSGCAIMWLKPNNSHLYLRGVRGCAPASASAGHPRLRALNQRSHERSGARAGRRTPVKERTCIEEHWKT